MTLTDLSPPPSGPVSLAAAKIFLRVDHAEDDTLISDLIGAAARQIEGRCGVSLITRPQRMTKRASAGGVYLHRYPVTSIDAVEREGQALSVETNLKARPVFLRVGGGNVQIDFTAGFGASPEDVPTPLRQGVLLLLAHLYEHRGAEIPPSFPMMVDALIQPYRGVRL